MDTEFQTLIDELSVRAQNAIRSENINSLDELAHKSEVEMRRIPGVGLTTLQEIASFLHARGRRFGEEKKKLYVMITRDEDGGFVVHGPFHGIHESSVPLKKWVQFIELTTP